MCGIFIRGDGCDLASTELTILFLCLQYELSTSEIPQLCHYSSLLPVQFMGKNKVAKRQSKESLVLFQDPIIDHANKKNRITAVRLQHKNVNLA